MFLHFIVVNLIAMVFCTAANCYSSDYAVVDLKKVLNDCELGQGAKKIMKNEFNTYDDEIKKLRDKLKSDKVKLEAMETSSEHDEFEKRYNLKVDEYKVITNKVQNILREMDSAFTGLILELVFSSIQNYNNVYKQDDRESKYVAIFEKNQKDQLHGESGKKIDINTISIDKADDITDTIIKYLDDKYPFSKHTQIFSKYVDEHKYTIGVSWD